MFWIIECRKVESSLLCLHIAKTFLKNQEGGVMMEWFGWIAMLLFWCIAVKMLFMAMKQGTVEELFRLKGKEG